MLLPRCQGSVRESGRCVVELSFVLYDTINDRLYSECWFDVNAYLRFVNRIDMVWRHVKDVSTTGRHKPPWPAILDVKLNAPASGGKRIDCFDLHFSSSMLTMLRAVQQIINKPQKHKAALAVFERPYGTRPDGPVFHVSVHHGHYNGEDADEAYTDDV